MELASWTALITGGTAGIGLACEAAAAGIGGSVRFIQADLSAIESVKSLVQQAENVILVNNAASLPAALTVDQDVTSFKKTFDTNVRGTYFLAAGLVPGMLERGRGSIINVTMVASKGVPGASACSASRPPWNPLPVPGPPNSAPSGFGSTASPPVPRKPKA